MSSVFQQQRSECFDVVVVGGGLAGLCAALAAARQGAKTAIVQNRPVFGGNASSEIRVPPMGAGYHSPHGAESGLIHELILEDRARNHDPMDTGKANGVWDLVLYGAVRREPQLTHFLNTNVTDVLVDSGRIKAVVGNQLGSEIRWEITGKMFVDASGDGAVGAPAGVPSRIGQEARDEYGESMAPPEPWTHTLGSSLHFRARDVGRPVSFEPPDWAHLYEDEHSLRHRTHGKFDSGYWWIELGWPYDTITQNETLRDELAAHVLGVWDHIKNHCPALRDKVRNYALDWIGMVPGKRESRRFVGAHVLTQPEIQARELFPDRVGYGGWIIDDHTKEGIQDPDKKPSYHAETVEDFLVAPYSVPLRSLHVAEPTNLFLAGRLMSASRVVFNSLRVMQTLAALGQASGTAAAFCARSDTRPADLSDSDLAKIQQLLLKDDAYIPRLRNQDPADLARSAAVTASSAAPFACTAAEDGAPLDHALAQLVPVGPDGIERVAVFAENANAEATPLTAKWVAAEDLWDVAALERAGAAPDVAAEVLTAEIPANHAGWIEFAVTARPTPGRLYWLIVEARPGVTWRYSEEVLAGCSAATVVAGRWWFAPGSYTNWRTLTVRIAPDPGAYAAANVISGTSRPETWPNLWLSDPAQPLPQYVELELDEPHRIACVHLTFDTNLSRTNRAMPPLFQAPECVRDYQILAETAGGGWQSVARVRGNYQRKRVHRFAPVDTDRIRVLLEATNGAPNARIYEVRVYGE